jgi:hypothetical protein
VDFHLAVGLASFECLQTSVRIGVNYTSAKHSNLLSR